jgi:hypothetical protein
VWPLAPCKVWADRPSCLSVCTTEPGAAILAPISLSTISWLVSHCQLYLGSYLTVTFFPRTCKPGRNASTGRQTDKTEPAALKWSVPVDWSLVYCRNQRSVCQLCPWTYQRYMFTLSLAPRAKATVQTQLLLTMQMINLVSACCSLSFWRNYIMYIRIIALHKGPLLIFYR